MLFLYGLLVAALSILALFGLRWIVIDRNPSDVLILLAVICFTAFSGLRIYILATNYPLFVDDTITQIYEWIRILGISSILTGLGLAIREAKPVINRAPIALSFIPFLLLGVHPLIEHTLVLKELLLNIYASSAYLIALMLFTLNYVRRGEQGSLLVGTIFLLIGFVLSQLPVSIISFGYQAGILFTIAGVLPIVSHYRNKILNTQN